MKHLLLAASLLVGIQSFSQKTKKPKENEKFFYKEPTVETDDYKIFIADGVAAGPYSKFKMKVFNKTNDFLIIKTSEITLVTGDKIITNNEKDFIVAPNDENSKVVDFKGTEMQFEKYTIDVKGVFKASSAGKVVEAPNFDLPPTKNEFTAGNFTCILKKHDATTDAAWSKFECTYNGDGVGVLNPYSAAAIMPNNTDNANAKKSKPMLLEKGDKETISLTFNEVVGAGDLQKKPIKVKWNETFKESKSMKIDGTKIEMLKDEEKTAAKK